MSQPWRAVGQRGEAHAVAQTFDPSSSASPVRAPVARVATIRVVVASDARQSATTKRSRRFLFRTAPSSEIQPNLSRRYETATAESSPLPPSHRTRALCEANPSWGRMLSRPVSCNDGRQGPPPTSTPEAIFLPTLLARSANPPRNRGAPGHAVRSRAQEEDGRVFGATMRYTARSSTRPF